MSVSKNEMIQAAKDMNIANKREWPDRDIQFGKFMRLFNEAPVWMRIYVAWKIDRWRRDELPYL